MGHVLGFVLAVVASVIAVELATWMPRWTEQLLRRAVAKVPDDLQERLDEEWRADLLTWPSGIAQLMFAASLWLWGARNLRHQAGRGFVMYVRIAWLACQFAWLTGRLLWSMPHMRIVLVGSAINLILIGSWLAYGHPVLYWAFCGVSVANMGYQMWLTPETRVYAGGNIAVFVLASVQSAHRVWFSPGFSWGFVLVSVLINAYMIRKIVRKVRQLDTLSA